VDEESHFGAGGLEGGADAELFESLGGGGADGGNPGSGPERVEDGVFESFLSGDTGKVVDLGGGGEEDEVELAGGEASGGLAQRTGVLGKGVFVDADRGDLGAARSESLDEVGAWTTVFLEGDVAEGAGFEHGEELAPGIRLRGDDCGRNAELAEGGDGLGPAGGDRDAAEGVDEGVAEDAHELARADAGEQDEVVKLIGGETIEESMESVVIGDRGFAHGGRDEGFGALFADQLGNLDGAAGFEGEDTAAL
jgi:hypothetical protein